MAKIRTRFAPSPTGFIHIGGMRTALYAYALAKKNKGDFILRIEDTDKKREVKGGAVKIKEILKIFGLSWDEDYVQSERLDLYKKAAEKLVKGGQAYRDEGAIRLRVPKEGTISYYDFVLNKDIAWETGVLEEPVLLKSDGFPTYHLAVVVDDYEMGITHILRGHDWLPSTPIHLLVYKYLGYQLPQIGHLTDILDPQGGKLSKRKGGTSCDELLKEGYLPEAILNFIMLLGWAPKDNRELFTLDQFIAAFDPAGFQKANPVFNRDKLNWFNGEYIRKLKINSLKLKIFEFFGGKYPADKIGKILPLTRERIKTLKEFESLAGFFFERRPADKKLFGKNYQKHLKAALEAIKNNISLDQIPAKFDFKVGDFFMDIRIAITGSKFTPPINESILILGKEESLKRLKQFI